MKSWDSSQYLRFEAERTRPCRDLINAIPLSDPKRIIDFGCGPGNSTMALVNRWPNASIIGLDSSVEMLEKARADYPKLEWQQGDISTWSIGQQFDVVFSNAALQWVPNHEQIYPNLLKQVSPGGVLAVQVPANINAPAHQLMRELTASANWREYFPTPVREWHSHDAGLYYDLLSPFCSQLDLWYTDYQHIMESPAAITEWYKGTGLRPFLTALPDEAKREQFLADYTALLETAFPRRRDGCVIFPFRRLFLVAHAPLAND